MSRIAQRFVRFHSGLRRFSLASRLPAKKEPDIDGAIDEEFHFMPVGKGDVNMQTRVSFISKDMSHDDKVGVHTIASHGFRMIDGQFMFGPVAIFPKTILSWRVPTVDHINEQSLELFLLLEPKLDLFILGAGDRADVDKVYKRCAPALKAHRIPFEILTTEFAIPTFNYMNNEGRYVAAALFPPDDIIISRYQHGKALQLVRDYYENDFNPLLMGLNSSADGAEAAINNFFESFSPEERTAGVKRVLEIREASRKQTADYFAERRERAEEERLADLVDVRKNLQKHLEEHGDKKRDEPKKIDDK